MTTSTAAKKDTQRLQRAIVDGLEDVKAQDIVVFDTEHLSSLFERIVIASGTSNRQTKALAASVRDAVREAGFPKPRIEGEANGEWIIVDCLQVVVHVMQPSFRQYYNLEELWGEKPVRLKLGSAKPTVAVAAEPIKPVKAGLKPEPNLKRSNAAKKGVAEAFPSKAQVKKDAAKAAGTKVAAKRAPARKVAVKKATTMGPVKTLVINAPVKTAAKPATKPVTKSAVKPAAKKAPAKKAAAPRKV